MWNGTSLSAGSAVYFCLLQKIVRLVQLGVWLGKMAGIQTKRAHGNRTGQPRHPQPAPATNHDRAPCSEHFFSGRPVLVPALAHLPAMPVQPLHFAGRRGTLLAWRYLISHRPLFASPTPALSTQSPMLKRNPESQKTNAIAIGVCYYRPPLRTNLGKGSTDYVSYHVSHMHRIWPRASELERLSAGLVGAVSALRNTLEVDANSPLVAVSQRTVAH